MRAVMRDDPRNAPYLVGTSVYLLSKSTGCFTYTPAGIDFAGFSKRRLPR